jgi:hypothetical protein
MRKVQEIGRSLFAALLLAQAAFALAQDRNLVLKQMVDDRPEMRLALLIGNSAYSEKDPLPQLKNPKNDAHDIAEALRKNGFGRVTVVLDADYRTMREAIQKFGDDLRDAGKQAVGLFYYAGHGVEHAGNNYLVPIGTRIGSPKDLEFDTIDAQRVLAYMEEAGNAVNIVVLDACRDNPFPQLNKFRSSTHAGGLAQMRAPTGSFIAFAAAPGQKASDGEGRNGLFTQHFLDSLRQPNSNIDAVFTRVTAAVTQKTGRQQVPWKQSSLTNDFFFRPKEALPGSFDPKELERLDAERKRLEMEKAKLDEERRQDVARMERERIENEQRMRAEQERLDRDRRAAIAERERQRQEEERRNKRRTVNIPITP